jgi:acetyltransferase-like isoleucine patch superfamily enzyme
MNLATRLNETPPAGARHRARLARSLYRRAFAAFGVIGRPQDLRRTERIFGGKRCAFCPGAWLACEDGGRPPRIGDDYFGHRSHLHAADPLTIGDGRVFVDDVYVGTANHDRDVRSLSHGSGPVVIGDRVFLGQRVPVLAGVTIGDGASVGAHSVVTRDVRPGAIVASVPVREIGRH